jgi:polar amino acid transport system permease protein
MTNTLRITAVLAFVLGCALALLIDPAYATSGAVSPETERGLAATLLSWLPLIMFGPKGELGGFVLNILVSFLAMAIGTGLGVFLGIGQVTPNRAVRAISWTITQFFRNSPWLVLLFFVIMLLPFNMQIAGISIPMPAWIKATIGLSLPVMGNISEVVRGSINSIPTGQWEAAHSLAFSRKQIMWMIILPQCVKRMLPPWMNWYAILTMATPLISIVGVNDAMTLTQDALAAESRSELLIPMYLMLLILFFCYCYPIARLTLYFERKFSIIN